MTFIWPFMLVLLLVVPLAVVLYIRFQRRRRQMIAAYGSLGGAGGAKKDGPGLRRHIPPVFFLASLSILMVALARPQATVSVPKIEGTVILAFDVSGSMAATDITPTRLDAAKAAVQQFILRQPPDVQIGVAAFSDSGFSMQAPTNDQAALIAAVNRLTPQHGTSLGNGIAASLNAITAALSPDSGPLLYSNLTPAPTPTPTPVPQGTYTSAVIILLTDGENNENPDPLAAAQAAAARGIRIDTVGIGSPEGTTLHINGFTVFTQLDEATLKQISQITGGTYYNAQSAQDLQNIYSNLNPQLIIKPQKIEITSLFAGAGIFVLLIGGLFSFLWFNRLP
jgi:Ca-activated chloride channel family protein